MALGHTVMRFAGTPKHIGEMPMDFRQTVKLLGERARLEATSL